MQIFWNQKIILTIVAINICYLLTTHWMPFLPYLLKLSWRLIQYECTSREKYYYDCYFIDQALRTHTGQVTCPCSFSYWARGSIFEPPFSDSQIVPLWVLLLIIWSHLPLPSVHPSLPWHICVRCKGETGSHQLWFWRFSLLSSTQQICKNWEQ